jgi:hypothetical protein
MLKVDLLVDYWWGYFMAPQLYHGVIAQVPFVDVPQQC